MILVTGASGFIGSHLVRELIAKGHHVRCLVRSDCSLPDGAEAFLGDMRSPKSLLAATQKVDAVYHLAASTSEKASSSQESFETNVQGAEYLVEACRKNKVKRLIAVSTQSTKRRKQGNYGFTKQKADEIFMRSGLDWTI